MLTSHESEEDFIVHYDGLVNLTNVMGLEYDLEYLMQDACPASRKAVLNFFPNVKILMCYFHVKKNVRENIKSTLDKAIYNKIETDLKVIHMSHNKEVFETNKAAFKKKYSKKYNEAYSYCSGWFEGIWSNWQIYCNKPGHANTNSIIYKALTV